MVLLLIEVDVLNIKPTDFVTTSRKIMQKLSVIFHTERLYYQSDTPVTYGPKPNLFQIELIFPPIFCSFL